MSKDELLPNGELVGCCACGGHGLVQSWDGSPDECRWCDGTGRNWQYSGGAIARYYGGPLIGRPTQSEDTP